MFHSGGQNEAGTRKFDSMIGEYEIKCHPHDLTGDMENVKHLKVCDKHYVSSSCRGHHKPSKGKSLSKLRSDAHHGNLKVNPCIVVSSQCGSEVCLSSGIFCKKHNASVFNDLINHSSLSDCAIATKPHEEMEHILTYQEEKYTDEFPMASKLNAGIFIQHLLKLLEECKPMANTVEGSHAHGEYPWSLQPYACTLFESVLHDIFPCTVTFSKVMLKQLFFLSPILQMLQKYLTAKKFLFLRSKNISCNK